MDGRNQVTKLKIQFLVFSRRSLKFFIFFRTIDSVILGYAKQALKFFLVDPDAIMDVVSFTSKTWKMKLSDFTDSRQKFGVWTDSRGHGSERHDTGHGGELRETNADHLPRDIVAAQPSVLHGSPGDGPPLLRRQPAAGEEWRAHPAKQDALLQHGSVRTWSSSTSSLSRFDCDLYYSLPENFDLADENKLKFHVMLGFV
jgi:hypothetical protein